MTYKEWDAKRRENFPSGTHTEWNSWQGKFHAACWNPATGHCFVQPRSEFELDDGGSDDPLGQPTHMTKPNWDEIARGAIERHLGDVADEGMSTDSVYDEAYTLALDALVEAGLDQNEATKVAIHQAQLVAQP